MAAVRRHRVIDLSAAERPVYCLHGGTRATRFSCSSVAGLLGIRPRLDEDRPGAGAATVSKAIPGVGECRDRSAQNQRPRDSYYRRRSPDSH
jgi:hypothetical protein